MAAPNIVNVTNIIGSTDVLAVPTTATAITTNAGASGKVYKINTLLISNVDATNSDTITVDLFRGATAYTIIKDATIPVGASLVAISKDNPIYLEEGDSLRLTAATVSRLEGICSYEEIN